MMGKTHFQIGILSYVIVSTIPVFKVLPFGSHSLTVSGMVVAGIAGLMADADSQHSRINRLNPIMGMANGTINTIENIVETILGLIFTFGIGVYIFFNSKIFIGLLSSLEITKNYAVPITYSIAALFMLLGFTGRRGRRFLRNIPIIGNHYKKIMSVVRRVGNKLKRGAMFLIYSGAGLWIIIYNYLNEGNINLYFIGLLFIGIAIFPHRSFLHSIEGFVLFTIAVWYIANITGHMWIVKPFIIGYFSHLYLTDVLTKEGVSFSSLPLILEKIGIGKTLGKLRVYRRIKKILSFRIRIPFMSTGSTWGNIFEKGYVIVLLIVAVSSFMKYNGALKIK